MRYNGELCEQQSSPLQKNTELTLWHAQGQADSGANADARYRQPADSDHGDQP